MSTHSYTQVDQYFHYLAQLLARINRTLIPSKADDSHTNLAFDSIGERLTGRWVESSVAAILPTLKLRSLEFQWVNDRNQVVQSLALEGETDSSALEKMAKGLAQLGLSTEGFMDPMHYEIPDYSLSHKPFSLPQASELDLWVEYRQLANEASTSVLNHWQKNGEVRIWPHHFDTGIYLEPNGTLGIGFGWAMEDEMVGEPYFYLAGYGLKGPIDYENISKPGLGRWNITENWKGAVLPFSELSDNRSETLRQFIANALSALDDRV
ncbi:hypothetical protein KFE98_16405 [bacterium SCSIO 12741]|nr:hypothetical protein KFE98_16405 [bacterium SCSIO 12741]